MKEANFAVKHLIKRINFLRGLKTSLPIEILLKIKSFDSSAARYIVNNVKCNTLQDLIDLYDKSKEEVIFKPRFNKKSIEIFNLLEHNETHYWQPSDYMYVYRLYDKLACHMFEKIT